MLALWLLVGSAMAEGHSHEGWTATNTLPTEPGNYYLTGTAWLSETWTAPQGVTNLCLNGKTIAKSSSASLIALIKVPGGATLNLYDEAGNEGKITGGDYTGGAIFISGGTFNMFGGQITGNVGADAGGGGVYLASSSSVFNMHDGVISNNRTSAMTGRGGGVYVNNGQFTMSGGTISGNHADGRFSYGGGVSVNGGTFTMTGGSITGNSATQGGGVYNSRTFNVSGTAIIKDNTANSSPDNIELVSIYKINVTGAAVAPPHTYVECIAVFFCNCSVHPE